MNAILLQCCGCAEKIVKLINSVDAETNCKDVEIAKVICGAIVCVAAIIVLGSLLWRLMDHIFKGCQEGKKREHEVKEKERKQKADLQDKLIDFLEKNTTKEEYNADSDKSVKTLRELSSEESQYYIKVVSSLIDNQTIPDYPQKPEVAEK